MPFDLIALCDSGRSRGARTRLFVALGVPERDAESFHVPADLSGEATVDGHRFRLLPGVRTGPVQGPLTQWQTETYSEAARSLADLARRPWMGKPHRLQAACPCCGRWIPVGRMHQHAGQHLGRKKRHATSGRFESGVRNRAASY